MQIQKKWKNKKLKLPKNLAQLATVERIMSIRIVACLLLVTHSIGQVHDSCTKDIDSNINLSPPSQLFLSHNSFASNSIFVNWPSCQQHQQQDGYLLSWSLLRRKTLPTTETFLKATFQPNVIQSEDESYAIYLESCSYIINTTMIVHGDTRGDDDITRGGYAPGGNNNIRDNKRSSSEPSNRRVFIHIETVRANKRSGTARGHMPWKTTENCFEDNMYLNDTKSNLLSWKCESCPDGASCRGKVNWQNVKAKAGYFRIDSIEASNNETNRTIEASSFWPCSEPLACMGAVNTQLERSYKWSFSPKEKNGSLTLQYDQNEQCNTELGFREICKTKLGIDYKCRLCRACKFGYYPSGKASCSKCRTYLERLIVIIIACGKVMLLYRCYCCCFVLFIIYL